MFKLKSEKAITLSVLITTVIILLILSTIAIYSVKSSKNAAPYNKMLADINLLQEKVLDYYSKNGVIPKKNNTQTVIDGKTYYEVDIDKLEYITLNYGLKQSSNNDIYLIDDRLNIYYKEGIELDGQIYHINDKIQNDDKTNDTSWILADFAKRNILEDGKGISNETLNNINSLTRRFTSYEANGQTYNLTKEEVLSFLMVFYGVNDEELIVYTYHPIFWSTHVYGEGETSYNRRVAIINYLNNQDEVTGMLRGDVNEDNKIDDADIFYLRSSLNTMDYYYMNIPDDGEEYDEYFKQNYLNIVSDTNNDYSLDLTDITRLSNYLKGNNLAVVIEDMTAKYYIDSDDAWQEEELNDY